LPLEGGRRCGLRCFLLKVLPPSRNDQANELPLISQEQTLAM
jgi:hypothetical protein